MLMDANYGYSKFQTNKKGGGWPALQVQLMLELVGTSRKMNQFDSAVIHLTRLLDVMFLHLQVHYNNTIFLVVLHLDDAPGYSHISAEPTGGCL